MVADDRGRALLEPRSMADPTEPRRVSDAVHERLRAEILDGRLAPGDAVPSERALAEDLGVNRHAVREALKRLEQSGLVRITQGGATRVQDWRDHGGVDLLLDLARGAGTADAPPHEVVVSVLELRELIGVDAARRFASRAGDEARGGAAALAEVVAVAVETDDDALVERYEDLWRAIVSGAGNVAYRLMLNSLTDTVAAYPALARELAPSDPAPLRELAGALRTGDGDRAVALLQAQLHADVLRVA
jgi:DNA-binding FadR family transcriptional regulator